MGPKDLQCGTVVNGNKNQHTVTVYGTCGGNKGEKYERSKQRRDQPLGAEDVAYRVHQHISLLYFLRCAVCAGVGMRFLKLHKVKLARR
jgi:hypothetical protein